MFEYKVISPNITERDSSRYQEQLTQWLNALGNDRWELVSRESDFYIFKRIKHKPNYDSGRRDPS